MKKYLFASLLIASWLTMGSSCEKNNPQPETCNVKDPVNDLDWLKKVIDNAEAENSIIEIYTYIYQDKTIFEVLYSPNMNGERGIFFFCDGNIICGWASGFTGISGCVSFEESLTNKELIFKKP